MNWRDIFPSRLQALRESHHLSKHALGALAGVTNVSIREFEIGRKVPTIDTLVRLADALECNVGYLLGLTDEMHPYPSLKGGDSDD